MGPWTHTAPFSAHNNETGINAALHLDMPLEEYQVRRFFHDISLAPRLATMISQA